MEGEKIGMSEEIRPTANLPSTATCQTGDTPYRLQSIIVLL